MSSTENFVDLKDKIERINREINKTEGAIDDRLEQLKKKHNAESEEELRLILRRKSKALKKKKKAYARIESDFRKKWKHKLDES